MTYEDCFKPWPNSGPQQAKTVLRDVRAPSDPPACLACWNAASSAFRSRHPEKLSLHLPRCLAEL
jgi:hypothetical protein